MWQSFKNIYHFFVALGATMLYGYPARHLTVIGVTGTDGKTTTSTMIHHILKSAGKQVGLVSTVGAKIGNQIIPIGLHVTTPSPFTLQKLLKQMVQEKCQYAVIEVTSHGLDQNRLVGCNFSLGVLTNITHEHLDYHKTFVRYVAAKAKLFRGTKVAILNIDGPWYDAILKHKVVGKKITYGLSANAQINPQTMPITLPLPGDYNLANGLGASAVVNELGIAKVTIQSALATFPGVEGRLEKVEEGQPFTVIVDFAHTPNATKQVLETLDKQTTGRLIAMFGSAGLRDKTKRPITGKVAATIADICIITADDPATEDVNDIIAQIIPGALQSGAVEKSPEEVKQGRFDKNKHVFVRIPDRKDAIFFAMQIAKQHDTVALLSKGHQKSISIGKEELPWNEKQIAIDVLKELGYGSK